MEKVKAKLIELLKDGKISGVLGFIPSSNPIKNRVFYTENPDDVEKFVVSPFNTVNPLTYLIRLKEKEKVACFLRPCEQRGLNVLLSEGILKRENVFVVGVPCNGAIDPFKLKMAYGGDITSASVKDGKIIVDGAKGEKEYPMDEFIPYSCKVCEPLLEKDVDLAMESNDDAREHDGYKKIEEFDNKKPDEKWEYFKKEFSKCTRCYACRESCPMCYCEQCFVDSYDPLWVEPGLSLPDIMSYHLIKMYHMAGRCTNCGTCERACPENIPLSLLTSMLAHRLRRDFEYIAGKSAKQKVFLGEYHYDDRGDFIK